MTPIERAIEAAGGLGLMATKCKVKYQAVQRWRRTNHVPAERVLDVEAAAEGLVSRHRLRPDIYPRAA